MKQNRYNRAVSFFLTALLAALFSAAACGKKEAPPLRIDLDKGIALRLPAGWALKKKERKKNILTGGAVKDGGAEIIAAVCPARNIPFDRQVQQDRNNLNLRKGYSILMEKNREIRGYPAYNFIATSVKAGKRFKSNIILFQKDSTLFYITLKAEVSSYEQAIRDFKQMIERI